MAVSFDLVYEDGELPKDWRARLREFVESSFGAQIRKPPSSWDVTRYFSKGDDNDDDLEKVGGSI